MATFPDSKVCNKCKADKVLTDFYLARNGKYGRKSICAECEKARTAEWRVKAGQVHRDKARARHVQAKYGMSSDEHKSMLSSQNHKCKICGTDEVYSLHGKLYVDHCHISGNVRGLLCNRCNSGLGMFQDSATVVLKALQYLQENT